MRILIFLIFAASVVNITLPSEDAKKAYEDGVVCATQNNDLVGAIHKYKEAIALDEQYVLPYRALGDIAYDQGDYAQARFFFQKTVQYAQGDVLLLFETANRLLGCGAIALGCGVYASIMEHYPNLLSVHHNYAYTLKLLGRFDDAIGVYKNIIQQESENDMAHLGLAFAYMMHDDYVHGWEEHAWNLRHQGKDSPALRTYIATNTLPGKRIFLRVEGGLGDTINFFRYAKRLRDAGAIVYAQVQSALYPLLKNCAYVDKLFTKETAPANTGYDAAVSYMSMPALLHDLPETMSMHVPYMYPEEILVNMWKERVKQYDHTYKIGICWQADVYNDSSRMPIARRGIPLALLLRLATIPGVQLFSLQKKDGVEQIAQHGSSSLIYFSDLDEEHGPFMDTAALMMHLDLIISIDSAVAHLAGALGRPVWLLLPYATDWRWYQHREDTCWYPTMRLFQQPEPFDWKSVVDKVYEQVYAMLL